MIEARVACLLLVAFSLAACDEGGSSNDTADASPQISDAARGDAARLDAGRPDAGPVSPDAIGLNDVSVLFPLPTSVDDPNTLRLSSEGNGGALLPEAMFDQIELFADNDYGAGTQVYGAWRIVAARIDPCFPTLSLLETDPASCKHQIRLVAQPIIQETFFVGPSFVDSAVHLLYDLSESDFIALATAFVALDHNEVNDPQLPLGIHPVMAREGLDGEFATALRALILQHAGASTLSRVTFMEGRGNVAWEFGGFLVTGGALESIAIHGLDPHGETDGHTQALAADVVTNTSFGFIGDSAETDVLIALSGENTSVEAGGSNLEFTASRTEIDAALALALRIDNPNETFDPDTIDCVSCHVAGRAMARAATFGFGTDGMPRYTNDAFNLEQTTPAGAQVRVQSQRAFGFLDQNVILNERTINESAENASAIARFIAHQN